MENLSTQTAPPATSKQRNRWAAIRRADALAWASEPPLTEAEEQGLREYSQEMKQ